MKKVTTDEFKTKASEIYKADNKYNGNELRYILDYLNYEDSSSGRGGWTSKLERQFADMHGMEFGIAHNSGTSTLHSCLAAIGVGAFDEIIGPVQTGIWFSFVCLQQNAIPVFVDSDPNTFNMDPSKIEEKITEKTKAIIPTHMHGAPTDMDAIMHIAEKYNLWVIEDCAQSFLGTWNGRTLGTIGHMSSFSFETKKHMTSDQGGIVLTNDEVIAEKIRKHGGLGYKTLSAGTPMVAALPAEFQRPDYLRHDSLGYNYRMADICAVLALAQLERLKEKVEMRQSIAQQYIECMEQCDWLIPQFVPDHSSSSYWTLAARFEGEEHGRCSWQEFYQAILSNGGDGFFGGLANQVDEIIMAEAPFLDQLYRFANPEVRQMFKYSNNDWPVAKALQPKLMQFKTGFRNDLDVQRNVLALRKTIEFFS